MSVSAWLAMTPFLILLALSPGPNNFTAMYNGIHKGPAKATLGATGRNLAFIILMSISALGLGAVILSSVLWFNVIKWIGVLYLLYLGIKTWRASTDDGDGLNYENIGKMTLAAMIRQEFLIAIANPKAILIFTAIFPQLLNLSEPIIPQFVVIGMTFLIAEYLSAWVYATSGMQLSRLLKKAIWRSRLNKAIGSLFIFAGSLLATSSRA